MADSSPLSLARCAIGAWLWHPLAQAPLADKPHHRPSAMAPAPLIERLALECQRLGIQPLGPCGALAAAQEFASRMRAFDPATHREPFAWHKDTPEEARERKEKDRQIKESAVARELAAAKLLAAFMPASHAAAFLEAVGSTQAQAPIQDEALRDSAKERMILSMTPTAASAGRSMSL